MHGIKDGVKLLARGSDTLTSAINIIVSRASAAAIQAVEKVGGTVTTRYYTRPAITRVLKGESHPFHSMQSRALAFEASDASTASLDSASADAESDSAVAQNEEQQGLVTINKTLAEAFQYRLPDPTSRKDMEYYRDPAHRGYLSWMVKEGQGPSLFFKTPGQGRGERKKVAAKGGNTAQKGENRIW